QRRCAGIASWVPWGPQPNGGMISADAVRPFVRAADPERELRVRGPRGLGPYYAGGTSRTGARSPRPTARPGHPIGIDSPPRTPLPQGGEMKGSRVSLALCGFALSFTFVGGAAARSHHARGTRYILPTISDWQYLGSGALPPSQTACNAVGRR